MLRTIVFSITAISVLGFSSTSAVAQDTKATTSNAACASVAMAPNASTWCTTRWGSAKEAKSILTLEATWISKNCALPPDLSFVAEDFHATRVNGTRFGRDKATVARGGADPKAKDRSCRMGDVDVRFFSDSTAVLYGSDGLIRLGQDGKEEQICMVWQDGWVKREGKWYLAFVQDNPTPCEQWWPTSRDLRTILPNYKELRPEPKDG